jgi:predicted TPR repeat methyltransferase
LYQVELTEYLCDNPATFDVIVSADTLVYFGRLDGVIAAAAAALRPGGVLIFTLEHAEDGEGACEFRLEVHGRYSHTQPYVERLLGKAGFDAEFARAELRMESGVPVAGLVVRATRPSSAA